MIINDFQRGKLPHYVAPPELKEDVEDGKKMDTAKIEGVTLDKQNLDSVQRDVDLEEEAKEVEGDAKTPVADEDGSEKGEEDSDDDDEAEEPTSLAVVGAGDWD